MIEQPVSELISDLKSGDEDAAACIWELYCQRVSGIARKYLPFSANSEDVADLVQSVFRSVFVRARGNGLRCLENRKNLEALFFTIGLHKAIKKSAELKRSPLTAGEFQSVMSRWTDHEIESDLRDVVQHVENQLDDDSRKVFDRLLRTGETNIEIGRKCGFSVAKVERKRRLIRETLLAEIA